MSNLILHKRSVVVNDGIPKLPTPEQLEYGELAINFADGHETLTIRNSADEIAEFKSKEYFENIIVENELVTAEALNDLNERITYFEDFENVIDENELVTATALNERITSVEENFDNIINENELVTSASLNDLNERVKVFEENPPISLQKITYGELVTLRNNGELIPGQLYRIIDYVTTTSQVGTQSAEHAFDVIVTALDTNILSEEARAIQHEGDTYFAESNLNAWKIWYCLDNNKTRFPWAFTKYNKTIIVNLYDEMELSAEYSGTYVWETTTYHKWNGIFQGTPFNLLTTTSNPIAGTHTALYLGIEDDYQQVDAPIINVIEASDDEGYGIIYRMIDEQGNDIPYDFKNIQFVRKVTLGKLDLENGTDDFVFTFNLFDENSGKNSDFSLKGLYCMGNNIKKSLTGLNDIVFLKTTSDEFCYSNTFGNNCFSNTFGNNCYSNTFGDYCYSNTFGDVCHSNTFGNNCYSNTFGNECGFNTFGDYCYENTFGDYCYENTFGNECDSNTFGYNCYSNTFGNVCNSNTFGYNCDHNTFRDGCDDNTFGNECGFNTFGNVCDSNTFRDYFRFNSFGNDCGYNSFRTSASTSGTLKTYCYYNHFDDGCSYNVIWNANTSSSSYKLQNINITRGVSGTSSAYNMINIDTLHAAYEIKVSKNSSGAIKVYCEADLIQ